MNYHYKDLEVIKTVILKAKKSIHDRGVKGQKETIISMQGYLMSTILSELEELYSADMRRQNMTKYNIFN
ncbi:hypothetical protein [Mammaliicoccus sciuri]|uniref:hypothetical protein n=1 Tax=Mammaliicoccus sciuri TaxID=1296 RepID=UPI003F559505